MSIKVSGIMINPAGESVANAQITLRAVTNSLTVLTGFSVTVKTSSSGAYSVQLEPGSYSLTVAANGHSFVYGAITLDETTGPSTLNQLLKQQLMESDLTPDLILYFRQIQQQVSNDLTTIKTLEKSASDSATNASNSRNEAKQYATDLSTALATAKGYRDQSGVSANTAKGFRDEAEIFANRAKSSAESIDTPALEQKINSKLPLTGGTITGPLTLRAASAITLTPIDETAYNWIHFTQVDGSLGIRMGRLENNGPLIIRDYSPGGITALTLAQGQYIWTSGNLNTTNAVQTLGLGSAAAKNAQSSPTDSDTSKLMGVGGFGIGTTAGIILEQDNTANATTLKNGFYNSLTQWIGTPGGISGQQSGIINIASHPAGDLWRSQILLSYSTQGKMFFRATSEGVWNTWREVLHSANTTVDSNGFLKKASPVVKLYGDGQSETNEESVAAMSERISEGVYKISGVLGFNSDDSWGGVDGGIEIPTDKNKQPLIWIDYELEEDGNLIIKTYHRTHPTSPEFAQNIIKDYEDGQPIDIPAGRFVDLRVQMPEDEKDSISIDTE
ncbi:prophage tail fiber N-terminal domain-containing protein [Yersinia rochesterensis]|uniref:phage tail fiber protein n=1 Tax=Yersinia rochesterensis TaxID=1604335 RepID=UPI00119EA09B|nr:prophage tail fiber N-terminal domain-containing protein [Yersinia rochesterensis]